ncbi:hypothetical protein ACFPFX_31025 [Streptomyces mauvecolor]|uniref:Uncharacterized protein n=1 Tax=Streptomyces mauvecolor TaxID=58345 RepID=A0ABV9UYJ4_9ACTN
MCRGRSSPAAERGFIRRTPRAADRRSAEVVITEAGEQVINTPFPRLLEREVELPAGLGADRAQVVPALSCSGRRFTLTEMA